MNWQFLIELEDQPWFPQILRNQITDALQFFTLEMKAYAPIIPDLLWVIQQSKTKNILDLCSGGTGPWDYLLQAIPDLSEQVEQITLTDLYPNIETLRSSSTKHQLIGFESASVNALNVTEDLVGIRTLFSCFHHFKTVQATSILQDAVDKKMPICVFEFTGRKAMNFLYNPVATFVLFTKLLYKRPLSPAKVLFSYLVPIVPLVYLWDSTVSHLRSYSQDELRSMVATVTGNETYKWEIGESGSPKSHLKNTFLIGYPKP